MPNSLQKEWDERCKLRAEGDKLWDEAHKLYAEGRKLCDEGDKLHAKSYTLRVKGYKLWRNALDAAGLTMTWSSSTTCTLSNGEIYYDT